MNPKVSIIMITYNQEQYIEQAVESVMMQQTDFPFKVFVGEDCSTDRTAEILKDLEKKHPDNLKVIYRPENLGGGINFLETSLFAEGEYVAVLEGDDYWVCPHKLQKQVDFFDKNPDHAICFSRTEVYHLGINPNKVHLVRPSFEFDKKFFTIETLLAEKSFMSTPSIMYRFSNFYKVTRLLYNDPQRGYNTDTVLNILNAQYGKIGFIDEVLAAYRFASCPDSWSNKPMKDKIKININCRKLLKKHISAEYKSLLEKNLKNWEKRYRNYKYKMFWENFLNLVKINKKGVENDSRY